MAKFKENNPRARLLFVAHRKEILQQAKATFQGILKDNSYYFSSPQEVKNILNTIKKNDNLQLVQNNFDAIENEFNWDKINGEYLQLFEECISKSKAGI